MEQEEKIQILKQIEQEIKFRENVLMPLFDKMSLSPNHTHGTEERGKDIVCNEENSFGLTEFIGFVAKVGRITGSTSSATGFQTVLNQVQEAFSYPYKDPKAKRDVSIAKVFVVTNDEILQTAQSRIVDKFGTAGAANANVHFIDGKKIVSLIDEHWPDFWKDSADILSDEDWMSQDAGLVLYVLSLALTLSLKTSAKKRIEKEMSLEKIRRQTGLSKAKVQAALNYLTQCRYVEKSKNNFRLHSKETVGKLLTDPNQIRLLFAVKSIANSTGHFTLAQVLKEANTEVLSFAAAFVKTTLSDLVKGDYIKKDTSRGSGHYVLDPITPQEEQPYLQNWLKYLGGIPAS